MRVVKKACFFPFDLLFFIVALLTTGYRDQQHIKWGGWRK